MSNEHKPLYTAEQIQKWSKAQLWAAYELDRDNTRMARAKDRELMQELYDALAMVEYQRQMKHRNRTIHDPRLVISVDQKAVWKAVKLALQAFKDRGITPTDQ